MTHQGAKKYCSYDACSMMIFGIYMDNTVIYVSILFVISVFISMGICQLPRGVYRTIGEKSQPIVPWGIYSGTISKFRLKTFHIRHSLLFESFRKECIICGQCHVSIQHCPRWSIFGRHLTIGPQSDFVCSIT